MHRPETLYLIDGYASIFRAFYAIRHPLHSPVTGEPTQAVLVFAQMLLKLFTRLEPDYVALALDAPGGTFRDDLYAQYAALEDPEKTASSQPPAQEPVPPEEGPADAAGAETARQPGTGPARYKGGRRATPDPLHQQVPRILELLDLFGVPVVSRPGLEADDVIATLADRVVGDPAHPGLRVRIVSRDKDLEQLVSERVSLYDIHTEAETDVAAVRTKRGVDPAQVGDVLALAGDIVDNIPGVAGIGPRTAAKLVRQFGSVAGILENLDQIAGRHRESLEQARPVLPISRRLVTLERDPAIPFSLDDARVRPLPTENLLRLFDELGFQRLKEPLMRRADGAPRAG